MAVKSYRSPSILDRIKMLKKSKSRSATRKVKSPKRKSPKVKSPKRKSAKGKSAKGKSPKVRFAMLKGKKGGARRSVSVLVVSPKKM
jgi:hypothetical protein